MFGADGWPPPRPGPEHAAVAQKPIATTSAIDVRAADVRITRSSWHRKAATSAVQGGPVGQLLDVVVDTTESGPSAALLGGPSQELRMRSPRSDSEHVTNIRDLYAVIVIVTVLVVMAEVFG